MGNWRWFVLLKYLFYLIFIYIVFVGDFFIYKYVIYNKIKNVIVKSIFDMFILLYV